MADFASMLKYLREREGLSQRELAVKLGMSASAIGMYESGKRQPKFEDEEAIADFFNVDLNTLRGRRNYTDASYEEISRAMIFYNTYLNLNDNVKDAIDSLMRTAHSLPISSDVPELKKVSTPQPDIEVPHLRRDNIQ